MLTSVLDDPTGYGRVIRDGDRVTRIVEQKDATDEELAIREFAAGMYAFDSAALRDALRRLSTDNAQGEEYLPDVVAILVGDGRNVAAVAAPASDTLGVNDRVQLATAHQIYNRRLLDAHMRAGRHGGRSGDHLDRRRRAPCAGRDPAPIGHICTAPRPSTTARRSVRTSR